MSNEFLVMTKNPFISIVIPHKNCAVLLERLLATIPDQERFQVIVVDDGSKLSELESVRNICKQRSFTQFVENPGPDFNAGVSRNIGLSKSRGEWVLFADSDDVFQEHAFYYVEKAAVHNENADVVLFRCASLTESGGRGARADYLLNLLKDFPENKDTILYEWLVPWGKLIRRDVLRSNDIWFDSCLASNDVMFSTKLATATRKVTVDSFEIYCCFHNAGSLTSSIDEAKALSRLGALARRNIVLRKNKVPIRKDFGLKYFFFSKPVFLSKEKINIYGLWFKSFIVMRF